MSRLAALEKRIDAYCEAKAGHSIEKAHVLRRGDGFYFKQSGREYIPSKTGLKFHSNDSFIRAVMGPVGSGKSTMCCMEVLREAIEIPPCKDGVRRSKWVMIRNTYPELKSTTLATFMDWFGDFGVSPSLNQNPPITYYTKFYDEIGECELTVLFLALDRDDHVKKLMSLEVSGGFINETRYVAEIVLKILMERVGRYPAVNWMTGSYKSRIIMDTNPPDTDSWWYRRFEQDRNADEIIFKQPAGLLKTEAGHITNPEAENLENLPADYYTRNASGRPTSEIDVQLCGLYGSFVEGDPVFSSYHDDMHSTETLDYIRGVPIMLGWDFGLTPAVVFGQLSPRGQLRVVKELWADDMFLETFIDNVVSPYINTYLQGFEIIAVGDPAGINRTGVESDSKTAIQILNDKGIPTDPASTNNIARRLNAVDTRLTRLVDGMPAFILSRTGCPKLRKGFQGKYCWKIIAGKKLPEKNEYSHPHDGLQYMALLANDGGVDSAKDHYVPKMMPEGFC